MFSFQTAEERGIPVQSVSDEVKANLEEIGHNFSLKTLRTMAFMIRKILCTLFRRVLVNSKGLERVGQHLKVEMLIKEVFFAVKLVQKFSTESNNNTGNV